MTRASDTNACVFCAASSADGHDLIVHEAPLAFVILNLYPYNAGHVMVVPRRHVASLAQLSPEELHETAVLTQRSEQVLTEAFQPQGINVGMNLVYFENYVQAAEAFDVARSIGLPQRMLRYQFGPFFAYYHANRLDDLNSLVDYALRITDVSEEAMIWKGWGYYRQGNNTAAIQQFRLAYETNPKSVYAQQALDFMGVSP